VKEGGREEWKEGVSEGGRTKRRFDEQMDNTAVNANFNLHRHRMTKFYKTPNGLTAVSKYQHTSINHTR
jgi:hypothetical protein